MKITKEMRDFLYGRKFDQGFKFDFRKAGRYNYSRFDGIFEFAKGKNVVHLGACSHLPLIEYERAHKYWLHDKLNANCAKVVGIDIDKQAVKYCNEHGVDNIYHADMLSDKKEDIERTKNFLKIEGGKKFDYIIAGEIVEHVDNPVLFLKSISEKYRDCIERIIITVPNAFYYDIVKFAKGGYERINTDHRYWFSPYTILKVAVNAGLEPEEMFLTNSPRLIGKNKVGRKETLIRLLKLRPLRFGKNNLLYNDIIVVAKL